MYVGVGRTSLCRVLPSRTSLPPSPALLACRTTNPRRYPSYATSAFLVLLLFNMLLMPMALSQTEPNPLISSFYPYSDKFGDKATEASDDGGSGKVPLLQPFPFFGKSYEKLYVNNNGVISFTKDLKVYRPEEFPLRENNPGPLLAPYWADVDVNKVGGTVWYRQTIDEEVLTRADEDIQTYAPRPGYHSTWAFIATWERVGFYGAVGNGVNKRNSFQCILVSDGTVSFVIIIYDRIEWTTGSNSRGSTDTGLGGHPAQAGFNAGDTINSYEIEGAGTDSVINLTRTSNVCQPGRWVFRVDTLVIHSDSGSLYLTPSSGSMLGGYEVNITGPCFRGASLVQALILQTDTVFTCIPITTGNINTDADSNSKNYGSSDFRTVMCVMPTVFVTGPVTLSILVDGQLWNYTGHFTFVNPAVLKSQVIRHSPRQWKFSSKSVSVSWKSELFPVHMYPQVSVEVMVYRDNGRDLRLVAAGSDTMAPNVAHSKVSITLPAQTDISLAAVRVKVPHRLVNGSYLSHWSDVFPVRWGKEASSEQWCSAWLTRERGRRDLSQHAACPCTLRQAESDTGRWQRDPLCSRDSTASYNCLYRGGKTRECIVPTYRGTDTVNQHCCYDNKNELLDVRDGDGDGGSTLDRYHFRSHSNQESGSSREEVIPWLSYLSEDVVPFLQCCQYSAIPSLCDQYRQQRAPVTCQGYSPPAAAQAAGDPHLVTLDGASYTFNGEGDFVLLQDLTGAVKVHVTATRTTDIEGQLGNATVFTAVAMAVDNETDVVEIHRDLSGSHTILLNHTQLDFTDSQMEQRGMTIYRNETGNSTVEFTFVMDTAGISVLVSATPDLLNIMVLVGSPKLKGQLTGLLGNYNGVKEDDFQPRSGNQIPITANMSTIHYQFGMTWLLRRNETLIYHPQSVSALQGDLTSQSDDYVPVFMGSLSNEDLRNGTLDLCQGNLQCIFDFQLTGKESIGVSTKSFSDRFENVIKEIAPVVRCPYVQHIGNGSRTLEGQAAGNKVYFVCDEGYTLKNGSSTLLCLDSGQWNSTAPDCVTKLVGQDKRDFLLISVGGAVGGFAVVIILFVLIRLIVIRCRQKYVPKAIDTGSEPEQGIELHTLFHYSETPNPVFENPLFLSSLHSLRSGEGRFQIPRPRYVDPNIYTEYF